MSLGWGEVPAGEWASLKTKPGADQVPPGDYVVQAKKYLHFEPGESGVGSHVIVCETTADNADAAVQGKELHVRMNYDLNPATDGRRKMNLISQQNAKGLFEATGADVVTTAAGGTNIVETLKAIPTKAPKFITAVKDGKNADFQELYNFRPFSS